MGDLENFRVLSTAEYQKLTLEQKLHYLERAFRHSCAMDAAQTVSPEAAEQSVAAESKI